MKFEIGYFLIYFLYLISYQMSRVFSRRIRDRLPFCNVHGGIEVINLHAPVLPTEISVHNSKKLFVRQRFKTLSSLYRRSSSVYVFRQERNEDTFA